MHSGDTYPYHGTSPEEVRDSVYNGTHILKYYFPNSPLVYALGNHDCFPHFQVEPNDPWLTTLADNVLGDILSP